ncbi:asparagine synthase (glutamine-hydrolyzing) [Aquimarina algiphila]|uniref:asparagine synthase (glutamine-hydrolyzing) n=1 Tax=Aquimarina algiphila TaxID=2047982 RepID=UPI00249326E3|nr:asparagine synthase (glutamine-hydrolyzing) [Aquimarina algiphila]
MCGIFGVHNLDKKTNYELFKKSLSYIKHRGPDFDQATQINEYAILGHTRLSIIDLSESNHQPFSIDERYTLTFNGEIFNYLEIKRELEDKGFVFRTSGDTEVVLQSYICWGEDCVNKFNGMWAFAIYDALENKLFCSRDRFGIKPFSYFSSKDELIFSSEIKPILNYKPSLRNPNLNVIANYCYKGLGAQSEQTWFQGILRLLPAHNLVWEKGKLNIYKYWSYPKETNKTLSYDDAKIEFEKIFKDSVNLRMRSDVKVGSTLTSGLDSSSIVGVINKMGYKGIDTFTAYSKSDEFTENDKSVYKEGIDLDESKVVKKLNKDFKTTPNLIDVSFSNYVEKLSDVIYFLESGHSSPATVAIHQVYKKAKTKIKVLMEGQGADELLAGYVIDVVPYHIIALVKKGRILKAFKEFNVFKNIYSVKYLFLLFLRSFDNKRLNFIKNLTQGIDIFNSTQFSFSYLKENTSEISKIDDKVNQVLCGQHTGGLVNLLHYGDALSMSQGIESRLPFMDYRLVEFAFKLPYDFKFNGMKGKLIQREALDDYIPDYISQSLIKIGFATPINNIINTSKEIEDILVKYNYNSFFNNDNIAKMLRLNQSGEKNFSSMLFKILSAKIWFKIFIDDINSGE